MDGGSTHTVEHAGPGAGLAVLVYGFNNTRASYGYVAGSAYLLVGPGMVHTSRKVLELRSFTKEVLSAIG